MKACGAARKLFTFTNIRRRYIDEILSIQRKTQFNQLNKSISQIEPKTKVMHELMLLFKKLSFLTDVSVQLGSQFCCL